MRSPRFQPELAFALAALGTIVEIGIREQQASSRVRFRRTVTPWLSSNIQREDAWT
jgi:hypothetical protein